MLMNKKLQRIFLKMQPGQTLDDMPYIEVTPNALYIIIDTTNSRLGEELPIMRSNPTNEDHIVRGEN